MTLHRLANRPGYAVTIFGQPASKANSRRIALVGPKDARRMLVIKSDAARDFLRGARLQVPKVDPLLEGPLRATLRLFYRTNLPDLDESLVLDFLQGRLYVNDRQVREKHVFHGIDKETPRAEIEIERISGRVCAHRGCIFEPQPEPSRFCDSHAQAVITETLEDPFAA